MRGNISVNLRICKKKKKGILPFLFYSPLSIGFRWTSRNLLLEDHQSINSRRLFAPLCFPIGPVLPLVALYLSISVTDIPACLFQLALALFYSQHSYQLHLSQVSFWFSSKSTCLGKTRFKQSLLMTWVRKSGCTQMELWQNSIKYTLPDLLQLEKLFNMLTQLLFAHTNHPVMPSPALWPAAVGWEGAHVIGPNGSSVTQK